MFCFFCYLKRFVMYIDLTKISDGQTQFDEKLQIDLEDESVQLIETVRIWGELRKGIVQVDIAGKISGAVEVECSRCLSPVNSILELPFKVAYLVQEDYPKEKDTQLQGDDLEIATYDGEKIELSELAREQILLNLPTQVYCQADCKGLCQKCGANLNISFCNCETKEIDPRWSALKNLK